MPHIDYQRCKSRGTPDSFPVSVDSQTGIRIATDHLPFSYRDVTKLHFLTFISKRFGIEQTYGRNVSYATGGANRNTDTLRTSVGEADKTLVPYCSTLGEVNPGTVFIGFDKETFDTLPLGNIFES